MDHSKLQAGAALVHYGLAGALEKDHALAHLGLAWMLENAAQFAAKLDEPPGIPEEKISGAKQELYRKLLAEFGSEDFKTRQKAEKTLIGFLPRVVPYVVMARKKGDAEVKMRCNRILARAWLDAALEPYRRAYALALDDDRKREYFGPHADSGVAFEAGKAIVRILAKRDRSKEEIAELARVKKEVAGFQKKGRSITPIVFPLRGDAPLTALIDLEKIVRFDLDGDDTPEHRVWVRPGTGILVWDPEGKGVIRSGRQMFGSVTWWIAWRNGYEPLAVLDDDDDGRLSGRELDGIAVWTDRDRDGVSDPGEVVPACAAGIASIAVRGVTRRDGVPAHPRGIVMKDGSTRPTYDWIARAMPSR